MIRNFGLCVHRGDVTLVNLLLTHSSDDTLVDDQGQNALQIAALNGHAGVVLVLLKWKEDALLKQVEVDQMEQEEKEQKLKEETNVVSTSSTLEQFLKKKEPTTAIRPVSVQFNAFVNLTDAKRNTALHLAAMAPSGADKVIRILLENGCDPNIGNWFGKQLLNFCTTD